MTVTGRPSWVYAVRNLTTGERWIGGAADVERAWRRHQRQLSEGSHKNLALQEAWETQEPNTFTVERLEEVPERVSLAGRVRAWVQQESHPYNKHWYPRLRPRVIVFREGDRVVEGTVHPPMIIHRIESASEVDDHDRGVHDTREVKYARDGMDAPEYPIIVAYTTYRLPFSERDLPLLVTEAGIAYVPVDAWCAVLGIRMKTHLWRLRRKFLWYAARELVVNPVNLVNPVEPTAPSAARGSASHRRGRAAQAGPPSSSTPASAPLPSWCLPRSKFLSFTSCVGWQRIDADLHPALRAMEEEEEEDEQLRMQERHQRIIAYGVQRPRILDALLACDRMLALIRTADKRLAPQLPVAEGAALTLLSMQGRQRISAYAQAARTALAQLRSGGITELTEYDARVDGMRTKIIPHDPTLPDVATMEAFATCEGAFTSWLSSFLDAIERYLPGTTFQRGS